MTIQDVREALAAEIRSWRAMGRRAFRDGLARDPFAGRFLPTHLSGVECEGRARALRAFATALPADRATRIALARGVVELVALGALPEADECRRLAQDARSRRP